jgi:hypothetical protein
MATGSESARNIHNGPGCGPSTLASWPKKRKGVEYSLLHPKKPSMEELKSELLRRDPSARCNTLSVQALAGRLLKLPPMEAHVVDNAAPLESGSPEEAEVVHFFFRAFSLCVLLNVSVFSSHVSGFLGGACESELEESHR